MCTCVGKFGFVHCSRFSGTLHKWLARSGRCFFLKEKLNQTVGTMFFFKKNKNLVKDFSKMNPTFLNVKTILNLGHLSQHVKKTLESYTSYNHP